MKVENCKGRYTHTEKVKTLRLLESNGFNYLQTSKQTNISRPTLRKWQELYGMEIFKGKSPTEEALIAIDAEMKHYDINILRHLYAIRKRTLQRVMVMAENEKKIEALVNLLKFVSSEIQKFSEIEQPGYDPTVDYIAIVTNALIENQKEQSAVEDQD